MVDSLFEPAKLVTRTVLVVEVDRLGRPWSRAEVAIPGLEGSLLIAVYGKGRVDVVWCEGEGADNPSGGVVVRGREERGKGRVGEDTRSEGLD